MYMDIFDQTVEELAKSLLGYELVKVTPEGTTSGIIVETEAYHETDEASHTFRGKTKRNEVMFGPAGHAYIYFTYGMHYCFNITAEEENVGAAVLIRALEPIKGLDLMKQRRKKENLTELCSGPAKLVQAMGITMDDYGKSVLSGNLFIKPKLKNIELETGSRIGISKAKDAPWRFWIKDSKYVSR